MKRSLLLVPLLSIFFIAPALASGWWREFFPTKDVVTPVVQFTVDFYSELIQSSDVSLRYPGTYSVNVMIRHTESNSPPRSEREVKETILRGRIELLGKSGVMYREIFEKKVRTNVVDIMIADLEISDNFKEVERFSIIFEEVSDDLKNFFYNGEVYVRRDLKNSIFE